MKGEGFVVQRIPTVTFVFFLAGCVLLAPAAYAQAVTCSNQDLAGNYAFASGRLVWAPVAVSPPGTAGLFTWTPLAQTAPGTSGQFSNTPIGRLAFGALGSGPFSTVGRLFADGGGNLFAGANLTMTGSYTVNPDCTFTMSLRDTGARPSSLANTAVRFEGVLQDRGNAAAAVQTNGSGFTQLSLERPFLASGCTTQSLSGGFGLSSLGLDFGDESLIAGGPRTVSPLSFLARISADGAGALGQDSAGNNSPLEERQLRGTYTINSDCTGTMTFTGTAASPPSTPGTPTDDGTTSTSTILFVLTQAQTAASGTPTQPGQTPIGGARPEILFVFGGERFSGVGRGR
jgi:hypothetical protein